MPRLSTRVDVHSQEYLDNERALRALVAELRRAAEHAAQGGSKAAVQKHKAAGKLTARERIAVLLDTGSPFLEFSQLAAHGLYGGDIACAGIITGVGRVGGRECVIVANDPTVKGGTYYPITVKKHLRAQEIAHENRLPCLYLVESGGGVLPAQPEGVPHPGQLRRLLFHPASLCAAGVAPVARRPRAGPAAARPRARPRPRRSLWRRSDQPAQAVRRSRGDRPARGRLRAR